MKVLADSNIFIDFWKKPDQALIETFSNEDIVTCGVVKAELMHGAKSDADLNRICELLDEFETLDFEASDWKDLGNDLYALRTNGVTVPFQDAVIALLAIKNKIPLWTRDTHFSYIQRVLKALELYEAETN